jgi:hypothetical protein
MWSGLSQRFEDHRQEDTRQFADIKAEITGLRADLAGKHVENQASIIALGNKIGDHEAASRRSSNRTFIWIIGVLLAVLGSIIAQSVHFRITLG